MTVCILKYNGEGCAEEVVFKKYSAILASDPQNWQAHFRLAFACYFMDEKEKAIESFKKVLTMTI